MKPSTKRLASFAAAFVMIIGSLVVFFDLVQPAYQQSQDLKGQILTKQNSLANQKSAALQIQNLLQQYHGEQSPQSAVSAALPLTNDQSELVHEIQALATANQLSVQSLAVSQPGAKPSVAAGARSVSASPSALVKPVGVLSAQIRVVGAYGAFKNFLANLETNIRLTDVQALVIAPVGKSNQDFYTFDLTASTYYQSS